MRSPNPSPVGATAQPSGIRYDDGPALTAQGGDMGALIRAFDWSKTRVGPLATWPTSLRTTVGVVLANRFPMLLWWGRHLVQLYNDAYRPILGDKHPAALGAAGPEVWAEIWHIIGPQAESVLAGEPATWNENLLLPMKRKGYLEETYFTFSYSAVPDDSGAVGGVLVTCQETTEQVRAERQLKMQRDLGARTLDAKSTEEACRTAAGILSTNDADIPFALLYLLAEGAQHATLVASVGLDGYDGPGKPLSIQLTSDGDAWPLGAASDAGGVEIVRDVPRRFGILPSGRWSLPPQEAIVLRLASVGQAQPYGFLVAGVNPLRALDERYKELYRLTAEQIATAIAGARAFEEEHERAETLADIDRAKTVFFSNVSHEFRTPLTLMLGPTEDLLSGAHGELGSAQRAQLELLRRNALRLQRLVNALLEFSRLEAGRSQASYEPVDLSALTRELASSFQAAIERAGLEFRVDCPALSEKAFVDVDMWEQIVLNLLSNALKFTFEGSIALSLHEHDDRLELCVADTGVGVRAEDVPRLFERFRRIEGTRSRTHEGSGIGLALVQELVRLHGGTITAHSTFGEGTAFAATIPKGSAHLPKPLLGKKEARQSTLASAFVEEALRWLPSEEPAPREPNATGSDVVMDALTTAAAAASTELSSARVLVADDNADMRDYLRRVLEPRFVVETVGDGQAALAAVKIRRPDVVLTDVMMPLMDGIRLLKTLRDDPATRDLPVIMLSARADEESRLEGLKAGVDDYLVKPFSARELAARVGAHVAAARVRHAMHVERAKLRSLFEHAPAIVCVLKGPEHVFELANPPYLRLIGDRRVIGLPVRTALPEMANQGYFELLDEVYRTGNPYYGKEALLSLARSDGSEREQRFVNFVYYPSRNSSGVVDGVMGFAFDVTDQVVARRRVEEERRAAEAAQERAELAVRARDEFLSVASHELRTPLTTLGLQIDGLLRNVQDVARSAAVAHPWLAKVERMRAQADRLEHLVEGMLEVFMVSGDGTELVREPVDLAAVAESVVDRARRESRRARDAIRFSGEPVVGHWDRKRLEQILTHLLSNALKFGGNGKIQVLVEPAGDSARLTVSDRGVGIAAVDQERIFERFERAVSTTHYGGFGLGLWVVRALVEAMHGVIRVDSEPGRGATFSVELPRAVS
ncbi:MAG TPA: ATP-binding protein [Polyangiaceae bacterium]